MNWPSKQKLVTKAYNETVPGLSSHKHHRLDVTPPWRTLQSHDDSDARHFMHVVYDAFLAHKAAYNAGILHRDISHNNILVTGKKADLAGILSDWDLVVRCSDKDDPIASSDVHHRFRTVCPNCHFVGIMIIMLTIAWHFMSVASLRNPTIPHLLQGDLESFFWLVLCLSLRWFDPRDLRTVDGPMADPIPVDVVLDSFKEGIDDGKNYSAGTEKMALVMCGSNLGSTWKFHENEALTDWVKSFRRDLRSYFVFYFNRSELTQEKADDIWDNMQDHSSMEKHFSEALSRCGWRK